MEIRFVLVYNIIKDKYIVIFIFKKEGVTVMATSSIYNDVKIKDKAACRKLVSALDSAVKAPKNKVAFSRSPELIKGEKIKEIFQSGK